MPITDAEQAQLYEQAARLVEQNHGGQYRYDGNIGWRAGPLARNETGMRREATFITHVEIEVLRRETDQWFQYLSGQAMEREAAVAPAAGPEAPAGAAPATGGAGSTPTYRRIVSPGGRVSYRPAGGEGHREEGPQQGAGGGGGGGGIGDFLRGGAAQGAVLGGVASSLVSSGIAGVAAPLQSLLQVALQGLGGTGAGLQQIGNAIVETLATAIRVATGVGATVLGGALGLLFGGAIAGIAGMLVGAVGGLFSQVGRALGETIGGLATIFSDTTRSALGFVDSIMRVSVLSGVGVQSMSNWVTTLRALGLSTQQATAFWESFGQRIEFTQMRLAAFGVTMTRTPTGELDAAGTLMGVRDKLQQYPDIMRRPMAQAMLGPQADALMPIMETRGMLEQAQADLAPQAKTIQRLWEGLRVPVAEVGLLWERIKLEFIGAFVPLVSHGIRTLLDLWSTYGKEVIRWFEDLPGRAERGLTSIANWLRQMWQEHGPQLARMWDGFIRGVESARRLVETLAGFIRAHPTLTAAVTGGLIGGAPGAVGGAVGQALGGVPGAIGGIAAGAALNRILGGGILARGARGLLGGGARAAIGGAARGALPWGATALAAGAAGYGLDALWGHKERPWWQQMLRIGGDIAGGAAVGAGVGSLFGGVGAIPGAIAGGVIGGVGGIVHTLRGDEAVGDARASSAERRAQLGGLGPAEGPPSRLEQVMDALRRSWERTAEQPREAPKKDELQITVTVAPTERFATEIATLLTAQSWRQLQVAMG